jgi:hypothetical protein
MQFHPPSTLSLLGKGYMRLGMNLTGLLNPPEKNRMPRASSRGAKPPSEVPTKALPPEWAERRKTIGCILGVLGGLFGVVGALGGFVTYMIGDTGLIPEKYVPLLVPKHIAFPALGVLFALLGVIAGAASLDNPRTAGKLMIVSAVGGAGTALILYAPAALLLLAGSYFSLTHAGKPSWCPL